MLVCLDVDYRDEVAVAACVGFGAWASDIVLYECARETGRPEEYEPGQFYRRELPCLLEVLSTLPKQPAVIIIDGYVWLGAGRKKGLGAHLFDSIDGQTPVVGVAKNRFHSAVDAVEVRRGSSERPLYVTSTGMTVEDAAAGVESMAGPHRIPAMLKRVDRLCRDTR